jgi:glycosyltransferase involved in cell wall biosynthesis
MHSLTIGIPTYNRKRAVTANVSNLIDILREGNFERVSVLVIDNESTDGTFLSLSALSQPDDKMFRVLRNEKNLEYNGNFVRIFEEVKSEYLLFLSDEDFLNSKHLNDLIEFLNRDNPLFVSSTFYLNDHVRPYRGKLSRKRIELNEFLSSSFYLSGLVFNVEHSLDVIKKSKEFLTQSNQIYPQVLLVSILMAKGKCCWFEKPLARKQFSLDTSIVHNGGRYDLLEGRWIQYKFHLQFFYFWKNILESDQEKRKVSTMIKIHNRYLIGKLYSSIILEYPELKSSFLVWTYVWLHKQLLKKLLKLIAYKKHY